jgi:hypothetical protein
MDYVWWMPWISWVPILSFVALRHATPVLRQTYSTLFAWLGRCSLEMFVLQAHIFLAADAQGILSLGLFHGDGTLRHDRWRDLIFLVPIFIWVGWRANLATRALTSWAVGESDRTGRQLPLQTPKKKRSSVDWNIKIRPGVTYKELPDRKLMVRIVVIVAAVYALHLIS